MPVASTGRRLDPLTNMTGELLTGQAQMKITGLAHNTFPLCHHIVPTDPRWMMLANLLESLP